MSMTKQNVIPESRTTNHMTIKIQENGPSMLDGSGGTNCTHTICARK
jgi:hypothetical protein